MQVVSTRVPTGVGSHVEIISRGLQERGVEIILSPLTEGPLAERARRDGLVVRCPGHAFRGDPRTSWRLAKIARQEKVDIVHTHGVVATFYSQRAARHARLGTPVTTIHSEPEEATKDWRRWKSLRRLIIPHSQRLLTRACRLICISSKTYDTLRSEGIPDDRLVHISNTIDVAHCDDARCDGDAIRRRTGIPADAIVIGFVGRLSPTKDPVRFVELAEQLLKSHPDVQFLIVGDGPLMPQIREYVGQRGIAGSFHLTGWQDEATSWIAAMDLLLVTSRTETGPLVAYEAMALEKPVVGTRVGSLPQLVANDTSGFLSNDPRQLIAAVKRLLSQPDALREQGANARASVLQHIAEQDSIGRLESMYKSVLAEANGSDKRNATLGSEIRRRDQAAPSLDGPAEVAPNGFPKRIVMVFGMSFEPYQGRYLRSFNQARSLANHGWDVTLLAWDRSCESPLEEVRDGIRIRRFHIRAGVGQGPRKNAPKMLRFNLGVKKYLMRNEFDVVHCFNLEAILTTLLAAKRRGAKAVLDVCEPEYYRGFWGKRFGWLLRGVDSFEIGLARRFDHVFVHNQYQLEKFRTSGVQHVTQVGSYPNRCMVRTQLPQSSSDEIVIGRLGTVYANNGFEEFAAAFQHLLDRQKKRGDKVHYKLFLAGRVFDDFRPTFDRLTAPFQDRVEVSGPYQPQDLVDLYRRIDISVLLYGRQSFGNVTPTKLFESMANGVPVVGNAVGEMGQIIEDSECGIVVDERDPESICNGIECLAEDQQLRRSMAENATRQAYTFYTFEACEDQFLGVYRSL